MGKGHKGAGALFKQIRNHRSWANQLKVGALIADSCPLEKHQWAQLRDPYFLLGGVEGGSSPPHVFLSQHSARTGMIWDPAHFLRSHVSLCVNKVKISTINLQSQRNPRGRQIGVGGGQSSLRGKCFRLGNRTWSFKNNLFERARDGRDWNGGYEIYGINRALETRKSKEPTGSYTLPSPALPTPPKPFWT